MTFDYKYANLLASVDIPPNMNKKIQKPPISDFVSNYFSNCKY